MQNYHIGLPAWAFAGWNGKYFTTTPSALASYASVFNTVEGNTTFYHIPDEKTVENWCQSVEGTDFRFCFKFPKTITHAHPPSFHDLELFLKRIKPLENYLGPFLLQFPSTVGANNVDRIESILANLPESYRCAIEIRHEEFFSKPEMLEPLLAQYMMGRVIMDTRPVFEGNRQHPEVLAALHKKPDLPVPGKVYNGLMMVRLLLHPDLSSNEKYIDQWVSRTAKALIAGCQCYLMIHCPNNQHCPQLALVFHEKLRRTLACNTTGLKLPALPSWPVPQQQDLL